MFFGITNGSRTRVISLKGICPNQLDDRDILMAPTCRIELHLPSPNELCDAVSFLFTENILSACYHYTKSGSLIWLILFMFDLSINQIKRLVLSFGTDPKTRGYKSLIFPVKL